MARRRVVVAVAVAVAIACKSGTPSGIAVTRDSAGIRIVENSGPAWEIGKGWSVVDSPLVDIGGRVGEPAYELDQVRGPVVLSDGRLAIVNGATSEIRLYDAGGRHLASAGRAGAGPGEYQNIVGIWGGPGDSLLIFDVLIRRLTVVDGDAKLGRVFSLTGQGGQLVPSNGRVSVAIPLGWSEDGSVLALSQSFTINQSRTGIYRDTLTVIRYGADGGVRDTLGRFPGAETEQMTLTLGTQSFSAPSAVPLGKVTSSAVGQNRFFVTKNDAWEIEIRGLDGKLHTVVRGHAVPARITPSDMAAHRKEQLTALQSRPELRNMPEALKQQLRARVEQAKYPATLPFFGSLLVDASGNLWAEQGSSPAQRSQRYDVVDSTGRWLGVVGMPADFHPTSIKADAIYGIWTDADKVQHVRGYRLRKS
jgi:hypothetical protein